MNNENEEKSLEETQESEASADTEPAPKSEDDSPVETPLGVTHNFGRGYKQDEPDERDFNAEQLFGAPAGAVTIQPASMMQFRIGELNQGGAGSCVAHALARGIDMTMRAKAGQQGDLGALVSGRFPKASRRFIYFNARQQENVDARLLGQEVRPVEDVGSYPRLAMRAVQRLGFCDERFFPYTDDDKAINETPNPTAFQQSYDQKDFRYYRIASTGEQKIADVSRALARGNAVIFGMFVDTAFANNKGERITSVNTRDPNGGGHMMTVLAIEWNEAAQEWDVIFDNWWRRGWGSNGIGRMSAKLFAQNTTDNYVIEATPVFSSGAA